MGDPVTTIFAAHGVLGISVLGLAGVCWKLQLQVKEVQDARVADAKAVTTTVLQLVQEQHAISAELTAAIVDLRNSLEE